MSSFVPAGPAGRPQQQSGATIRDVRMLVGYSISQMVSMKGSSNNPIIPYIESTTATQANGHCASFVSAYLRAAGRQDFYTRGTITGAPNLQSRLLEESRRAGSPWTSHHPFPAAQLPRPPQYQLDAAQERWWKANFKVGDPVFFGTEGGGDYGHAVIYSGIVNGQPMFIGANNVEAGGTVFDGEQKITEVSYGDLVGWMNNSGTGFTSTITSAFSYQAPLTVPMPTSTTSGGSSEELSHGFVQP